MSILLGWMWGPFDGDRDVYAVVEGFERWQPRAVDDSALPWRSSQPDAQPLFGHLAGDDPPAPGLTRFELGPFVDRCLARLRPAHFDVNGKILMTLVTDDDGAGLAVQVELATGGLESLADDLGDIFSASGLVLYGPQNDTLYSRGVADTSLLSASSGHHWQPGWNDVTSAMQQLVDIGMIVLENQRGDVIQLAGSKGELMVECRIGGDPVEHAVASRDGREKLNLDDAFHLFKSFYDDGERSPWFSWRPAD